MAYDGLIYDHFGRPAGIPWDMYMDYKNNEPLYTQFNRPIPQHSNVVVEPDGSSWRYVFSYDQPYWYLYKTQVGDPTGTNIPDPTLYIPPINYPTPVPDPTVITPTPSVLDPTRPLEPLPAAGGSGDVLALAGFGLLGLAAGSLLKSRRSKNAKKRRVK